MKKVLTIVLTTGIVLTASFKSVKPKSFTISGDLIGFPDSTLLFLSDLSDGSFKDIDSTFVVNKKFSFRGVLKEMIMKVAIRTKDFSDRTYFWLENSKITFSAEKGKFKEALIRGSVTQEEQYKLNVLANVAANKEKQNILFIQQHPSSIISAELLSIYSSTWSRDTVSMLYINLSKGIKNTVYGKNVSRFLALNKNLKIGDKYADFSQADINDKTIKLSDFQGKLVLLEFWGSWCGPCRKDNPELVKTYYEYKDKGFEILGVAADSKKADWLEAVNKDGLPWPNVCDLKGDKNKASLIYGVSYYPTNFLIDKTGTIIAKDLRGEKLKEKLEELLK